MKGRNASRLQSPLTKIEQVQHPDQVKNAVGYKVLGSEDGVDVLTLWSGCLPYRLSSRVPTRLIVVSEG